VSGKEHFLHFVRAPCYPFSFNENIFIIMEPHDDVAQTGAQKPRPWQEQSA